MYSSLVPSRPLPRNAPILFLFRFTGRRTRARLLLEKRCSASCQFNGRVDDFPRGLARNVIGRREPLPRSLECWTQCLHLFWYFSSQFNKNRFFTVPEEVLLVSACNSVALGSNTCTCDKPHSVNAASKASCVFVAFAATS